MTVPRLGSSESEKEGVVLEKYANKVVLRGWYTRNGQNVLIPGQHFSRKEIAAFLGLVEPAKPPARKPISFLRRVCARIAGEDVPA